jgi:Ulp1 family protease
MQQNSCDCGVLVCRYALGMFKLCFLKFTKDEAGIKNRSDSNPAGSRRHISNRNAAFSKLITNGVEFNFDCDDIHRIRIEYQTLIMNMHPLYAQFYMNKVEMLMKEKKAIRKDLRRIAKAIK